ncbi:MAG: hypothetical protein KDD72_15490, partial [Anaerolineales bacterium]|nr:hypothetical protein [Anaerolineales bacterium]
PTFDVSSIVTVTPAESAACPAINPNIKLDMSFNISQGNNRDTINSKVLKFLNQGGSPQSVIKNIRSNSNSSIDSKSGERAIEADITGDGVLDLLIAPNLYISIFSCENRTYKLLDSFIPAEPHRVDLKAVEDANNNGILEIYIYINECLGGKCYSIRALEWNGTTLRSIIFDWTNSECTNLNEPFEVVLQDIDNDNIEELTLIGTIPPWPDEFLFPNRDETRVCKWNKEGFVFYRRKFSEPKYRFQALQDADIAAIQGEFTKAFNLYQRTISDQNLEWWTALRRFHEYEKLAKGYFNFYPTPTPDPTLTPDPAEYPSLAAYAYYRIILLHLVQGQEAEAASTYQTLQDTFGTDLYAKPYIEMATAFWEAYQSTQKMYDGCAAAIQYAVEHPEILTPLGSDYHGWQSHIYVPADVCPFR